MLKRVKYLMGMVMAICLTFSGLSIQCYANETSEVKAVSDEEYIGISTKEELNNIRYNLSANYYLENDIVFEDSDFEEGGICYNDGEKWIPLGAGYVPITIKDADEFAQMQEKYGTLYYKNSSLFYYSTSSYDDFYSTYYYSEKFTGNFDGRGHRIINLQIDSTKSKYVGLFGRATGTISNLGAEDCLMQIDNTQEMIEYGTICADAEIINNCYVTGKIDVRTSDLSSDGRIGGIAGYVEKISECGNYASINVTGKAYVGGIVGLSSAQTGGLMENCYNAGNISGDWSGGLIGLLQNTIVKNSYNVGKSVFPIFGRVFGANADSLRNLYYLNTECEYEDTNIYDSVLKERFKAFSKSYYEMIDEKTYTGFDFTDTWTSGNSDYPFPVLKEIEIIPFDVSDKDPCFNGHKYMNPQFNWSEDGKSCTIALVCANNAEHKGAFDCSVSFSVKTDPTCNSKGITTYTAVYDSFTATKDIEDIPATGEHVYDSGYITKKPTFETPGEMEKVCKNCGHVITIEIPKLTGTWRKDNVGWWYALSDGSYLKNCTVTIDNFTYRFDNNGYMVTGWKLIDEKYYYFDASGAMQKSKWIGECYVDENGVWDVNKVKPKWMKDSVGWWYRHEDKSYTKNDFEVIDGKTYYFNSNGYMVTGWQSVDSKWYYFNGSGIMKTGWVIVGNTWYYMDAEGKMYENQWLDDTYYLTGNGTMAKGWMSIDDKWYYFNTSGAKVKNSWIGNYYLKEDGRMAVDEWVDNGKYYVDNTGRWVQGK